MCGKANTLTPETAQAWQSHAGIGTWKYLPWVAGNFVWCYQAGLSESGCIEQAPLTQYIQLRVVLDLKST